MTDDAPLIPVAPPVPEHPDRWDIVRFILLFILFLVLAVLILIAIAAVLGGLPASGKMSDLSAAQHGWLVIGISVAFYVSLAGSVWFAASRRRRDPGRTLAFRPVRWFIPILAGIGLVIFSVVVSLVASQFLKDIQPQVVELMGDMTFTPLMVVIGLLVVGVLGPIAEEMFFRGLLFGWLRAHWPFWPTAIVTSALFGLVHGSLSYAVVAGALGLMLAWLRERSGSLWTSIAAHVINNLFAGGMAMLAASAT